MFKKIGTNGIKGQCFWIIKYPEMNRPSPEQTNERKGRQPIAGLPGFWWRLIWWPLLRRRKKAPVRGRRRRKCSWRLLSHRRPHQSSGLGQFQCTHPFWTPPGFCATNDLIEREKFSSLRSFWNRANSGAQFLFCFRELRLRGYREGFSEFSQFQTKN